jgi:hypothetical protein
MTTTSSDRFSRRAFVRGLGASGALLPLLHAERAAAAPGTGFPRRLITIGWSNGVAQPHFWPAGDDPVSGQVLSSLVPFRSKVLIPAGLDYKVMLDAGRGSDGHFSYPSMYSGTYKNIGGTTGQTATTTGPTVDQFVSDELAKRVKLPVPLLNVFVRGDYLGPISYRSAGVKNKGESNPWRLFDALFGSRTLSTDQIDALRSRRQSVLDHVGRQLTKFAARLGTEDRAKIDAHLQSIRQLEQQLGSQGAAAGCQTPSIGSPLDLNNLNNYPTQLKLLSDLTAVAMRCDLTRVASLSWADDGGSNPSKLPFIAGSPDCHGVAHQGSSGYATKIKIDQFYFSMVAHLAKLLDDTPEAGGTMLDNSVIVAANDMNEGAAHYVGGIPFLMIGSCGGVFRTGRCVRLGNFATRTGAYYRGSGGVPHNRLLATLCNAMDVPVAGFGDPKYPGTLSELTK